MWLYTTSSSRPSKTSPNGTGPSGPMTVVSGGTSVMGSRRRAAAIASPSRVCAFSRLRSSRSCCSKSSWSVTVGAGVVMVSLSVVLGGRPAGGADRNGRTQHLAVPPVDANHPWGVDLVVLSGYAKRVGPLTIAAFDGRMLNVHPAPLSEFGGQGMYGMAVHEAVLSALT